MWFRRLLERMGWRVEQPEPLPVIDAQSILVISQQVQQTAYWSGYAKGKNDLLDDLERSLAARNQDWNDLELQDVQAQRHKLFH